MIIFATSAPIPHVDLEIVATAPTTTRSLFPGNPPRIRRVPHFLAILQRHPGLSVKRTIYRLLSDHYMALILGFFLPAF